VVENELVPGFWLGDARQTTPTTLADFDQNDAFHRVNGGLGRHAIAIFSRTKASFSANERSLRSCAQSSWRSVHARS
jgi:hypothetical protein